MILSGWQEIARIGKASLGAQNLVMSELRRGTSTDDMIFDVCMLDAYILSSIDEGCVEMEPEIQRLETAFLHWTFLRRK